MTGRVRWDGQVDVADRIGKDNLIRRFRKIFAMRAPLRR